METTRRRLRRWRLCQLLRKAGFTSFPTQAVMWSEQKNQAYCPDNLLYSQATRATAYQNARKEDLCLLCLDTVPDCSLYPLFPQFNHSVAEYSKSKAHPHCMSPCWHPVTPSKDLMLHYMRVCFPHQWLSHSLSEGRIYPHPSPFTIHCTGEGTVKGGAYQKLSFLLFHQGLSSPLHGTWYIPKHLETPAGNTTYNEHKISTVDCTVPYCPKHFRRKELMEQQDSLWGLVDFTSTVQTKG